MRSHGKFRCWKSNLFWLLEQQRVLYEREEMIMTAYLIVCPLVFLAGLVDSIAGGGGLISLPGYLIAGVPAHLALGTNKMSSTIGTSISAVRLLKHGYLKGKMKMAIASAVCAMTGSVLGAKVSLLVSDSVIRHMMIVVLPIVAYHVLKNKNMGEDEKTGTVPYKKMFLISVTAAFFIGCYDGFYGPGTGTFLLLVFTGAAKMDTRSASAQTKVINLSSNIAALVTFIIAGNVYYPLGLAAAACSV
jgi:uncharacterized protein